MDALKRDAAILRGLLLAGPGITFFLLLFAVVAILFGLSAYEKRTELFLACMAFSLVCLVSRAATRIRAYCESADRLGIPRHAVAMRRAQCIIVATVTLFPIAFALSIGAGFRAVVVFVGAAALAIYLSEAMLLVVLAGFALRGVGAAGVDVWALLFGFPGGAVILMASAWGIVHWLRLPRRLEAAAPAASLTFADAAHESLDAGELDEANLAFERHLESVLAPPDPNALTPRRLWIGLSHDPRGNWRLNAIGICIALVVAVACHFWKHARWDFGVYLVMSGIFAMYVFGRFQQMNEAWLRTQDEQSLLVLTARWPVRTFRIELIRSVWTGIPALLAGWLLFSAAEFVFGWIDGYTAILAAAGHVAVIATSLGIFLSYFAYSRVRRTNLFPMIYLLIAIAGTATLLTSMAHGYARGACIGAVLLLAPAVVAFLAFFLRPVLFPVQIEVRK